LLFVLFLLLSASTSSARSVVVGGTLSKIISPLQQQQQQQQSLFGLCRHPNRHATARAKATVLLQQLRGGSSLGGGRGASSKGPPASFRPTPTTTPKNTNPFRKTKESTKPSFRTTVDVKDDNKSSAAQDQQRDGEEDVKEVIDSFLTRDSRNSFIARVYGILSVQLAFTALVCLLFGTYPPLTNIYNLRSVTGRASPLLWVPLAGVFASTIAWFRVAISPNARQKSPNKWWWLALFTFGEAFSIGAISSLYQLRSVITAMGATALATVTVSMYTITQQNPKYDLSQWGATLSSWMSILLVYLLIGVAQNVGWLPAGFLPYSDMLYSLFAVCLFTLFLAHHTKLIVGGKHSKYQMNDKDYVFGAMALYVDIVNIFLHILQLIGRERE
jgi:FtsH-binding integral membrane protein